jgi:hypothetical protein
VRRDHTRLRIGQQVRVNQPDVATTAHPPEIMTVQDRARSVAWLLGMLLLQREEYAERWQRRQERAHSGLLNQAAIAKVIEDYLWSTGERPETDTGLARSLKDTVRRALRGTSISTRTLTWFIEAFDMTPEDARRLRTTLNGHLPPSGRPIADTLRPPQELPIPQRHRTLSVFEHRAIGPDGASVTHRTSRAIIAQTDTVYFYPCRQFSAASEVNMLSGGRITATLNLPGSSPILEMTLSSPLPVGQVGSLEYQADFAPGSGVMTEYRQVAHARADNVNIVVQFHHNRLPRRVWWTVWDDSQDGTAIAEQPVTLDPDGRAHRYVPYVENAAVGFRWEW